MEGARAQSLRSAENLSLPQVQVIVMSANMGCNHCRQRISKVVSEMNRLLDYTVDLRKKEVTVRGVVDTKKRSVHQRKTSQQIKREKKSPSSLGFFTLNCFGAC